MPYRVVLINDNESLIIHSPVNSEMRLLTGVIHQSASNVDSFDFSFNQSNPADAYIKEQITEVEVSNVDTGKIEFEGRIRNRTGQTRNNGETVKRYSADDALIYLNDSSQYEFEFEGKPSELLKKLIEHHNAHVEAHKQFAIGRCEIDTYKVYVDVDESDDGETVNIRLAVGASATIKSTTKYIYDGNGTRLNIASSVLGVTHTVEQYAETGVNQGRYLLRHPNSAWGISGWIAAEDIEETRTTSGTSNAPTISLYNISSPVTSTYTPGTKVKIRHSATTYYQSSDGTGAKSIPAFIRNSVLTTREYSSKYNRYAIYRSGVLIAWINAADLEGGAPQPPNEVLDTDGKWITRTRTITAEIGYQNKTLDAIKEHLLRPFGGEIFWEKIEGVRTIHIVNRRINETDHRIAIGLNLISMSENFDPSGIITRLVPLGKIRVEEGN